MAFSFARSLFLFLSDSLSIPPTWQIRIFHIFVTLALAGSQRRCVEAIFRGHGAPATTLDDLH